MPLVTVHLALHPAEAQLVRSRLEAARLHPTVTHELSALSIGGYSQAAGGIAVQVPEAEAEAARAILTAPPPPAE